MIFFVLSVLLYQWVKRTTGSEFRLIDMKVVLVADGIAIMNFFEDAKFYLTAMRQLW